jgi:hypothetical protein
MVRVDPTDHTVLLQNNTHTSTFPLYTEIKKDINPYPANVENMVSS